MATKTWTGGTGTWDSTNGTNWSGGTAPVNGDTIVFDGTSGTGTVTVAANVSGQNFVSITMGAFVGTLDFSINNPSLTLGSFSATGTAVRALKLGSGTFTLNGTTGNVWDLSTSTSFTLTAGTSTIALASVTLTGTRVFASSGSQTYATLSVASATNNAQPTQINGSSTFGNMNLTAPLYLQVGAANTLTVSNTFTWAGTSSAASQIFIRSTATASNGNIGVPSGSSITWAAILNMNFTTNAITASNSLDLGGNSGITINPPVVGISGSVIGS